MGVTDEQRFGSFLWLLLRNGEDFRIMWKGDEYMNIGKTLYCNGKQVEGFSL